MVLDEVGPPSCVPAVLTPCRSHVHAQEAQRHELHSITRPAISQDVHFQLQASDPRIVVDILRPSRLVTVQCFEKGNPDRTVGSARTFPVSRQPVAAMFGCGVVRNRYNSAVWPVQVDGNEPFVC